MELKVVKVRDKAIKKNFIFWILVIGTILATLKCIFVSLQMDEEYAISLPYRLLLGDKMFAQIWDPHQTSAFLIQFLIWIFQKVTGTTTYVVIWIRFAGVLMHGAVAYYLYRFLKTITCKEHSFYLALIYFNLLPKTYVMPEFSNMMVWGLTMLLIAMSRLIRLQQGIPVNVCQSGQAEKSKDAGMSGDCKWNRRMTFTAIEIGFWICFMVLSYPSCVLMFPFVIWYVLRFCRYKGKTAGIITAVCGICGGAYVGYLLSYMTVSELIANIKSLVASCGSHSDGALYKLALYGAGICVAILFGTVYTLLTKVVYAGICKKGGKDPKEKSEEARATKMLLLIMVAFVLQFLHWILMLWKYESSYPFAVYFFIFGYTFYIMKRLSMSGSKGESEPFETGDCKKEVCGDGRNIDNKILVLWMGGNITMYVAILLLTNLTIFTSVKYLMPGVIMGMVTILAYVKQKAPAAYGKYARNLLLLWCFVAAFVKGWAYTDDDGLMKNITCVGNVISEGPGKGIFTEYMQGYMQESIYEEMQQYVQPGDNLLVIDSHTLCYLYQDVNVASSITICTPTFDENLLDYWERNPDKYPDVIAVRCWFGELKWETDGWLMNWIDEEYQAEQIIDGKYLRYYIKY